MAQSLEGRFALVIGGSGGIGAATRPRSSPPPARASSSPTPPRSAEAAAALAASLPGAGHLALPADVADTASLLALRDEVQARFGDRAARARQCRRLHQASSARRSGCAGRCADRPHVRRQLARPVRGDPHLRADAEGFGGWADRIHLLDRRQDRRRLLDRLLRRQGGHRRDDEIAGARAGAGDPSPERRPGRGRHRLRPRARRRTSTPRPPPPRRCAASPPQTTLPTRCSPARHPCASPPAPRSSWTAVVRYEVYHAPTAVPHLHHRCRYRQL